MGSRPPGVPPLGLFLIRTVHGSTLVFDRAGGVVASAAPRQGDGQHGDVVACIWPGAPHLCFLVRGDGTGGMLALSGDAPASVVSLRMVQSLDQPGLVSFQHPHTRLYLCAAPLGDGATAPVALSRANRNAFEWFSLVPHPPPAPAGAASVARVACRPLSGPSVLALVQEGLGQADMPAFDAFARLLSHDQVSWLAATVLAQPPTLELFRALFPGDVWLREALPALAGFLGGQAPPPTATLGAEYDFLAQAGFSRAHAPFGHKLNAAARRTVAPRKAVAVLATARNEGPYLLEWVAYHRVIGVEAFFIYSNGNDDGSDKLLQALAGVGLVTGTGSTVGAGGSPQPKAYGQALGLVPGILDYKWTAVIDLDEFIGFDHRLFRSLPDYLGWHEANDVDSIALNWLVYGSGDMAVRSPAPLASRFTQRLPYIDSHVKSITRTGIMQQSEPHVPVTSLPGPPTVRNERGDIFVQGAAPSFAASPSAGVAWIAHYFFKSAEEFMLKSSRNRGNHPFVQAPDPSAINPKLAALFLSQHGTGRNVHDGRMMAQAPLVEAEMRRIRALPGVDAALAGVERRYGEAASLLRRQVRDRPEFWGGDAVLQTLAGLLLAHP